MRKKLLIVNGLAAAAAAVALLVTAPGAEAATLPIGGVAINVTVTSPLTTYAATASSGRWSVVAINGNFHKLSLRQPLLGTGALRTVGDAQDPFSRWIAMDNRPGRRPTGPYRVDVTAERNVWNALQFVDGGPQLVSGQTFTTTLRPGEWLVDLREVRLETGDELILRTTGASLRAINVIHSRAFLSSNHTFSRLNTDLTYEIEKPATEDAVEMISFRARQSGDHAVIFENGWYGTAATVTPTILRAGEA